MSDFKETVSSLSFRTLQEEADLMGKHLEGSILTIIDASFQDPEQRKAVKDLVRQAILRSYHRKMYRLTRSYCDSLSEIVDGTNTKDAQSCPDSPFAWLNPEKLKYKYSRTEK